MCRGLNGWQVYLPRGGRMAARTAGLVACLALTWGVLPVHADTTYYYVGNSYTTYNPDPANLGTNITGSVTFNFDTTGVTGLFYLSGGQITDVQLTSGIYSLDAANFYAPLTVFSLVNGAITAWDLPNYGGYQVWGFYLYSFSNNASNDLHYASPSVGSLDQLATPGTPLPYLDSYSGGAWTIGLSPAPPSPNTPPAPYNPSDPSPVPGPMIGAGLPGLVLAFCALLGRRLRRRYAVSLRSGRHLFWRRSWKSTSLRTMRSDRLDTASIAKMMGPASV